MRIDYRIQEREYGGLADAARKMLRDIVKSINSEQGTQRMGSSSLHHGNYLRSLLEGRGPRGTSLERQL